MESFDSFCKSAQEQIANVSRHAVKNCFDFITTSLDVEMLVDTNFTGKETVDTC